MIEGYLTAPETGNYTFWLSSDDEGQFFMNTDSSDPLNPSKTNLICWVPGYSGTREWDKFPEQQSVPVALEAGKTYYLKILQKEGTGGDYIVLGWQTPSGTTRAADAGLAFPTYPGYPLFRARRGSGHGTDHPQPTVSRGQLNL